MNTKKIIALSWHQGSSEFLIAGGYKRFYEVAQRTPVQLSIIDRYPSIYKSIKNNKVDIIEYGRGFNVKFLSSIHPYLYKFIDRIITVFFILFLLYKNKKVVDKIYVPYSELPELTFPAILFKLFCKRQVILCNLNVNTYLFDRPFNVFCHKFASKIITLSSSLKKDLEDSGIYPKYINGVGFEAEHIPYKNIKKSNQAIFIGRHIPQKGILDLIDIWSIVVYKYKKNYDLMTIGDIPEYIQKEIDQKIKSKKLIKYINILGVLSNVEKNEVLLKSKLMVFPSKQEGWGIAPMEALSFSVPVVAYDLSVYQESIGKTNAMKVVKVGDHESFAKSVIEIMENNQFYKNATRNWKPVADWDKIAKKEWEIICQN